MVRNLNNDLDLVFRQLLPIARSLNVTWFLSFEKHNQNQFVNFVIIDLFSSRKKMEEENNLYDFQNEWDGGQGEQEQSSMESLDVKHFVHCTA